MQSSGQLSHVSPGPSRPSPHGSGVAVGLGVAVSVGGEVKVGTPLGCAVAVRVGCGVRVADGVAVNVTVGVNSAPQPAVSKRQSLVQPSCPGPRSNDAQVSRFRLAPSHFSTPA